MNRPRKVFGRRLVEFDGRMYRIEMRNDYILVRKIRGRRTYTLGLTDVVQAALGQRNLL
jgi:hypothetical protein